MKDVIFARYSLSASICIELNPNHLMHYIELGCAHVRMNRIRETIQVGRDALKTL